MLTRSLILTILLGLMLAAGAESAVKPSLLTPRQVKQIERWQDGMLDAQSATIDRMDGCINAATAGLECTMPAYQPVLTQLKRLDTLLIKIRVAGNLKPASGCYQRTKKITRLDRQAQRDITSGLIEFSAYGDRDGFKDALDTLSDTYHETDTLLDFCDPANQ